jgi:hypothetical protein
MLTRVVLPTYQRPDKLSRLIRSMDPGMPPHTEVHVGWSPGDADTRAACEPLLLDRPWLHFFVHRPEFHAAEFWNAFLGSQPDADIYIYLSDDCELFRDTLIAARLLYLAAYPKLDGLLGFDQPNLREEKVGTCPAAFGAIGRTLIDSFPDRAIMCPDYYALWVDQELLDYTRWMGKFTFAPQVRVTHHHPAANPADRDATHDHIRRFAAVDNATRNERTTRGLLWGRDYQLVRPLIERGVRQ